MKGGDYISHQAILMMALLASAVGKTTVKSPDVEDLSPPKSKTTTVGFVTEMEVVFGVEL